MKIITDIITEIITEIQEVLNTNYLFKKLFNCIQLYYYNLQFISS